MGGRREEERRKTRGERIEGEEEEEEEERMRLRRGKVSAQAQLTLRGCLGPAISGAATKLSVRSGEGRSNSTATTTLTTPEDASLNPED